MFDTVEYIRSWSFQKPSPGFNLVKRKTTERKRDKKACYAQIMTTYTQILKRKPLWPPPPEGPWQSGWDGPGTQSHSEPIRADDNSDIYTVHRSAKPGWLQCVAHTTDVQMKTLSRGHFMNSIRSIGGIYLKTFNWICIVCSFLFVFLTIDQSTLNWEDFVQ